MSNKPLLEAITAGNVEEVERSLTRGTAGSRHDYDATREAWISLMQNHADKFLAIAKLDLDEEIKIFDDVALTKEACKFGQIEVVRLFLNNSHQHHNALKYAVKKNNAKLLGEVMRLKPYIYDDTIIDAVKNGRTDMVSVLLEGGANSSATCKLHYLNETLSLVGLAAFKGHLEIFNLLLEKGADLDCTMIRRNRWLKDSLPSLLLNQDTWRVLTDDHFSIFKQFPAQKIELNNVKNIAKRACSPAGVEFITSLYQTSHTGFDYDTFLELCFLHALKFNPEKAVFEALVKCWPNSKATPIAELAEKHNIEEPLLHYAIKEINYDESTSEALGCLVRAGIPVDIKSKSGSTALHIAKKVETVSTLCSLGANINALDQNGLTPAQVFLSTKSGSELFKVLSEKSTFNVKHADKRGNNYLHFLVSQSWVTDTECTITWRCESAMLNFVELVEYLKDRGLDINAENCYGASPIDLAPNQYVSKILIENGANERSVNKPHPKIQELLEMPKQLVPKMNHEPDKEDFKKSVKEFKHHYGIKSIKALHDRSNPARKELRLLFFANPIVRVYLTRENPEFENFQPVLEKHEKNFYKTAECDDATKIPFRALREAFFSSRPPYDFAKNLFKALEGKSNLKESIYIRSAGDIYSIPGIVDELVKCEKQSVSAFKQDENRFQFIIIPTEIDNHSIVSCVICDYDKKETVALLRCDSYVKREEYNLFKERLQLNQDFDKKILVVRSSLYLQTADGDLNCALYSRNFCIAIRDALLESKELRDNLTKYTKQELADSSEKQKEIADYMRQAMRVKLPQYFNTENHDHFQRRSFEKVDEYHALLRWRIGNEIIKAQLDRAEDAIDSKQKMQSGF